MAAEVPHVTSAFPTEARQQQKARIKQLKALGLKPKARKVQVEEHHDDCGTSLESLSAFMPEEPELHSAHWVLYQQAFGLPPFWLLGSTAGPSVPSQPHSCFIAGNYEQAASALACWPPGDSEICVLSGGHEGTALLSVHRRIFPGSYLKLVAQVDPEELWHSSGIVEYVSHAKPLVFVLLPTWDPANANPLTPLCAQLASMQTAHHRHFLCEQPWVAEPRHSSGWWQFLLKPSHVHMDIQDRSQMFTFWASSPMLLRPLQSLQLRRNQQPRAVNAHTKPWSLHLSTLVTDGLCLLCAANQLTAPAEAVYPSVASGPAGPDDKGPEEAEEVEGKEWWRACPGCRGRQNKIDDRHNRIPGQCKYPEVESVSWNCDGCKNHRPRGHPSHTMGPDCKHVILEERKGQPRRGKHPRPPARKARDDASRDLQAQLPDQSDLGAVEEAEAAAAERKETASGGKDAYDDHLSDYSPSLPPEDQPAVPSTPREDQPAGRGPDRQQRERRTFRDAGEGTEAPSDWSRFDISRSMRVLRVGNERAIRTELRKLHLRFWHASRQALEQILKAAGIPQRVLNLVPDIINTCHECRKWQRPAAATQHALSPCFKFNQQVEFDLLFYRHYIVCHFICRATRWHAGCAIPSKEGEVLYESLQTAWVGLHGPMTQLIADGETGLWREDVANRIRRQGIELKLRSPQQHARYIERRGAILRVSLHVMETQLEREGLVYSFPALLAEAIFAGNSLVHVGGVTPYNAVYGRQPAMLPPLETPDLPNREEASEAGERQRAYIREAAVQAMVQATSLARLSRAAHARTAPDSTREFQVGDLVDIFRKPTSKDASGWSGPYRVTKSEPGQVTVQTGRSERTYRSQDTRHTLLVLYTANQNASWHECFQIVHEALQALQPGQSALYGFANSTTGGQVLSRAARQNPQVLHALDHLFNNCWRVGETIGARLARGAASLSLVSNASHSTIVWWFMNASDDVQFSSASGTKVNLTEIIGWGFERALVVQALHTAETDITLADAVDEAANHNHEAASENLLPDSDSEPSEPISVHTPQGPLSTIPESAGEDEATQNFLASMPQSTEGVRDALKLLFALAQTESLEDTAEWAPLEIGPYLAPHDLDTTPIVDPNAHYLSAQVDLKEYGSLDYKDEQGNDRVELWFEREFSKVVGDPSLLQAKETYVLQVFASGFRNAVIKRESDLLTPQELVTHDAAVQAAILEELRTWNKYNCFERAARATAHNVMDSKFVAKWKMVKSAEGREQRIVRMRLALRGFKDLRADELENYAATASRQSQRLLCSEVACHPEWKFIAVDVAKAFLQGMSYAEIHELTGEEEHEVHFDLPAHAYVHLRSIPEFENFDPHRETLKCLKPGTGCKDAPRAFSLKLAKYTRDPKIGLHPSLYDTELEMKHVQGRLVLILVKHVDDIKIAGEPREVDALVAHLKSGFGKLTCQEDFFTNCGLKHVRHPDGSVEMNQDDYISAMKPIRHPELTGRSSDAPCTPAVHGMYQSLLGALAYSLLSQSWAAVFVVALQRKAAAPLNLHARRLNILLGAIQKLRCKLMFPAMQCARKLVVYSDASFDKESEQKGYGMRGAAYLRMGNSAAGVRCHLLEAQSQSLKHVTRSTFAAETLAAVGAVDGAVPLLTSLEEVAKGTLSTSEARTLRESGAFVFDSEFCIDAMNLYHALSASYPKLPAEKALFIHIAWLRDFLSLGVPRKLTWVDTRDMLADGLTKGKVDRTALHQAMAGTVVVQHATLSHSKSDTACR